MLHKQGQDKFVYTCNTCKSTIKIRYNCVICEDFDLCVPCYDKEGHPHKMEKLGLDLEVSSSPGDMKQAKPKKERRLWVQDWIQRLVHACHCRDANCRVPWCQKVRRLIAHTKICKRKAKGQCLVCNEVIALWLYHAEKCQETKCSVPFCTISKKHYLKQQQIQQSAQQQQMLRRRMATLNLRCGAKHALHAPSAIKRRVGSVQKQQQQQPMHQKTLQHVVTLHLPANQHQEILQILKSNPPLMAALIKQKTQVTQDAQNQQQKGSGVGPVGNTGVGNVAVGGVADVNVGLGTGVPQQPQQMHQTLPQQTQVGGASGEGGVEGASGGGSPPSTPSPRPPTPSEQQMMRQSPAPPAPHSPPHE